MNPLPARTADVDRACADLATHGLCLVDGAASSDVLDGARRRLYEIADRDPAAGRGYGYDTDRTNQRVWALLNEGDEFVALTTDATALELVASLLDRRFLLSNISANITGPGGGEMSLHCDQGYVPAPWPAEPLAANAMWLLDDFTADNGATMFLPGSHTIPHGPQHPCAVDHPLDLVPVEAPAGTLCVMDGRVWHRTGRNVTATERRAGVFAYYVRPFLRTQENWFLSLDPTVMARAHDHPLLGDLLGLREWRALGMVHGPGHDDTRR